MQNISENFQKMIDLGKKYRKFNAQDYIRQKIYLINKFFTDNNLNACVLGLSGGIDSAVVYKLLIKASEQPGSPIKRILGIAMPITCDGTSNQQMATLKANILTKRHSPGSSIIKYAVDDLSKACQAYIDQVNTVEPNAWSIGQLASIVRTPHLYFRAALLQQEGFNSIVCGTTNRDEGSYIGFFGKSSDAMNDLQIIADIHKSEVYEIAKLLDVPQIIIDATPTGDVWDGRVDEEMIGSPYWFLELYLLTLENKRFEEEILDIHINMSHEEKEQFVEWTLNIIKIHRKNKHKYNYNNNGFIEQLGFAKYIDVMKRLIPTK